MKYSQVVLAMYMGALVIFSPLPELTYIEDFFGILLLSVFFFESISKRFTKIYWHWSMNYLVAYLGYAFLTVLFNPESFRAFISFLSVIVLFYIVFSIVRKSNNIIWLLFGLLTGLLYIILFNFDQILEIAEGLRTERFGGEGNPNVFAFQLILAITLLLKPLYSEGYIQRWVKIIIGVLILGCSYFVLVATGSRKGMILLALIFFWTYFYYYKNQSLKKKIISSISFTGFLTYFLIWFQDTPYYDRFESIFLIVSGNIGKETDYSERLDMISTGIDLWSQNPLFGWGFQAYKNVSGFGTYSHNNYIELLVNSGLVGFIIYYCFFAGVLFTAFKKYVSSDLVDREMLSWVLMVLTILLVWDAGAVSYYSKPYWILVGIVLGTLLNIKKSN